MLLGRFRRTNEASKSFRRTKHVSSPFQRGNYEKGRADHQRWQMMPLRNRLYVYLCFNGLCIAISYENTPISHVEPCIEFVRGNNSMDEGGSTSIIALESPRVDLPLRAPESAWREWRFRAPADPTPTSPARCSAAKTGPCYWPRSARPGLANMLDWQLPGGVVGVARDRLLSMLAAGSPGSVSLWQLHGYRHVAAHLVPLVPP